MYSSGNLVLFIGVILQWTKYLRSLTLKLTTGMLCRTLTILYLWYNCRIGNVLLKFWNILCFKNRNPTISRRASPKQAHYHWFLEERVVIRFPADYEWKVQYESRTICMVSAEVVIPLQNCALAEHTRSQVELLDLITPVFISPELLPLNIEQESQKKMWHHDRQTTLYHSR